MESAIVESLPTFEELVRFIPVAVLVVLLLGIGYVVGRHSMREFLDYLRDRMK